MNQGEAFLVIYQVGLGNDAYQMEIVNESELSRMVDGADYNDISVRDIYVLREGNLVKCEYGDIERIPYPDPENESSIIYAYSPLFAGTEKVASIPLTDH